MQANTPDNDQIVMTRQQVRDFDAWAINTLKIPGTVLMENAGKSTAEFIQTSLQQTPTPKVTIFCGTGNNGGDGFVIARHIFNFGQKTNVIICGKSKKIKGDALINLRIIENMNIPIMEIDLADDSAVSKAMAFAADSTLIVDAIFGTGLQGNVRTDYAELIDKINELNMDIIAVDIPSGLDCDTGTPLGTAIKAIATVTFVAMKKGFTKNPNIKQYTGQIKTASIGVNPMRII